MYQTVIIYQAKAIRRFYRRIDNSLWIWFQTRRWRHSTRRRLSWRRYHRIMRYQKQCRSRRSYQRRSLMSIPTSTTTTKVTSGLSEKVREHMRQKRKWKLRLDGRGDQVNRRWKHQSNLRMDCNWLIYRLRRLMLMGITRRCRRCITTMRIQWTHMEKRFCLIMGLNQVTAGWAYLESIRSIEAKGTKLCISRPMVARDRSRGRHRIKSTYSQNLSWMKSSVKYQSTQTRKTISKSNNKNKQSNTKQPWTQRTKQPRTLSDHMINLEKYQAEDTWNSTGLASSQWNQA